MIVGQRRRQVTDVVGAGGPRRDHLPQLGDLRSSRSSSGPGSATWAATSHLPLPKDILGTPTGRLLVGTSTRCLLTKSLLKPPSLNMAILIAMSISEQMSLADVKNRLSEVVERLAREHGRVVITKHGQPAAVVLSIEDLESLEETLEILGSASLVDDIRASVAEFDDGGGTSFTKEEALTVITDR